ncbi:DUF1272 domain-containing protein [Aeromicrobium fastidiosum]|uniref:DUF1272 domain-containing protein n=1 Tax=Aeromicrobium fastidiosum TaxID=52699 RepID=UPI00202362F9|nr:DUF1272 domain-containing protein [Aeromicrobium fastidiosum]MCL8251304.1 DUF1272 domain-containing protein [Aeromicrobium fastidiosum]
MLDIRPSCECCDTDLDPSSRDVLICSYECTWCLECATTVLRGVCPNCGGGLARRPVPSASRLVDDPPSTVRVFNPGCRPVPA